MTQQGDVARDHQALPNLDRLARLRTLLYVPGDRPDRFAKAVASGADEIVLDLEDAVQPTHKELARVQIHQWLMAGGPGMVRINSVGTPWHDDDVSALGGAPRAVVLPKAGSADDVADVHRALPASSLLIPIIETAAGVLAARDICSTDGVSRVIFGSADLARDLGVDHSDRKALAFARSYVVLASAASGIAAPLDGATTALADNKKLIFDAEDAAAWGFVGNLVSTPSRFRSCGWFLNHLKSNWSGLEGF